MRHELSFLLRALGFGGCAAALYPALISIAGFMLPAELTPNLKYPLNGYGHMRTRLIEAKGRDPVQIVFIGNSHVYRGFDTRVWARHGYTAFNLGSSAQSPMQGLLLARTQLPALEPKLVLVEVHPGAFMSDGVESALDLIANRPIDRHTLRMAAGIPNILVWNTLAYGIVRKASGFDEGMPEPLRSEKDTYVPGGYVERKIGHFSPKGRPKPMPFAPSPEQWRAFEDLLKEIERQGVPVVLVEAPVTRWMREGIYREHDRFARMMAASGRYIDMYGKAALDDSLHFYDHAHLNQRGAELFNAALIDTLRGRGWLPEPEALRQASPRQAGQGE
ncbi:MAG: hypothetical protein ACK4L7_01395 [Flavobacteriales bacterium]